MKHAATKASATKREFALAPLHSMLWLLVLGLWVVLLLAGFLTSSQQQPPHNPVPWWLMIIFGTALLPAMFMSMLAHREIRISGDKLEVSAALIFARKVPIRDLLLDKARVLNLDEHTEFKPMLQLGGFGLPGFAAGHYMLRNRSRAFCLLTRKQHVLLLPQHDGKFILISPDKPQALLEALREQAR